MYILGSRRYQWVLRIWNVSQTYIKSATLYRQCFEGPQNIYHHYRYDLFWTLLLHDLASNHGHWWCYCFLSIYYGAGESHLKIKFYIGVYPGALRRSDFDDSLFALTVPWPSSHVDNFYLCFSSINQRVFSTTVSASLSRRSTGITPQGILPYSCAV